MRADVTEKADVFRHTEGEEGGPAEGADLSSYQVNVLVDHGAPDGSPVVYADHPTLQNPWSGASITWRGWEPWSPTSLHQGRCPASRQRRLSAGRRARC